METRKKPEPSKSVLALKGLRNLLVPTGIVLILAFPKNTPDVLRWASLVVGFVAPIIIAAVMGFNKTAGTAVVLAGLGFVLGVFNVIMAFAGACSMARS